MDIEDKPHAAFLQRSLEIFAVPSESFCYPFVLIRLVLFPIPILWFEHVDFSVNSDIILESFRFLLPESSGKKSWKNMSDSISWPFFQISAYPSAKQTVTEAWKKNWLLGSTIPQTYLSPPKMGRLVVCQWQRSKVVRMFVPIRHRPLQFCLAKKHQVGGGVFWRVNLGNFWRSIRCCWNKLQLFDVVCNLLSGSLYELVHYNHLTVKLARPNMFLSSSSSCWLCFLLLLLLHL